MHSSDWKNHAGGEWPSPREVPYQQQKFLQKRPQRLQYGQQAGNATFYERWHVNPAAAYPPPMYATDDSGCYRRYSLDAPPESLIYYNRNPTAAFIGHSLDNVDGPSPAICNTLLYPNTWHIGDDEPPPLPDNVRRAFYFKQKSTQSPAVDANIINTEQVVHNLTLFGRFLEVVQSWPLPHVSFTTACILVLIATFISPRLWAQNIIFPAFRLSFGTLYPAYASYKAVRTKNVKEYVKWMMYWIVYAFFTCIETFTDIFLSWFPFYYEVKVIIVLWLLSPATKGSSTLYRKFVHPMLTRREQEIDEYLNQAKERGYSAVLQLGTKGVNYATNVIMQTALKGGGNLVQTLRRSYSLSDLSEPDVQRTQDEIDEVVQMRSQQRLLRPRPQASIARSASGTRHSTGMYFSEVDVAKGADGFNYNIRSSEDISSGYSSAEPVSVGLSRTSSMTNASKTRLKARRTTEILNEPEHKFRPSAQEFRGSLEDFEALHDSTVVDIQKCIQILEEMPDIEGDDGNCLSVEKMQTIDEINDVDCSFEVETGVEEIIKLKDQATVTIMQQQSEAELDAVEETCEAPMADIVEVALKDDYYLKEDNNSIYSNSDTYNTLQSSDEDNESDVFTDALPTLESAEGTNPEKDGEETPADSFEQQEITTACAPPDLPIKANEIVNQAVAQATTTSVEPQATAEKPKINAKELQDTLKAIKDNFRANIATTTTIPTLTSYTTAIDSKLQMPRPLTHNKGKAPAPPLPSRPTRSTDVVVSSTPSLSSNVDAASLSSRSPSPAPHRNIFRNIKSNLLRLASNNSLTGKASEANAEKPTTRYETQLLCRLAIPRFHAPKSLKKSLEPRRKRAARRNRRRRSRPQTTNKETADKSKS